MRAISVYRDSEDQFSEFISFLFLIVSFDILFKFIVNPSRAILRLHSSKLKFPFPLKRDRILRFSKDSGKRERGMERKEERQKRREEKKGTRGWRGETCKTAAYN